MKEPLWQLRDASIAGRLEAITLDIHPGITAVLGSSGAGKTTLLNLLVRFERPERGNVIDHIARGKDYLPLFWVPQDDGLWQHLTVMEHLRIVGGSRIEWMDKLDLSDRAHARPEELSQGERSRLSVARALAAEPLVLVMDEPLAHVSQNDADRYWEMIREWLTTSNASLVFATHSPKAVLAEAERVLCLKEGRLLYYGSVDKLYWRPETRELALCLGESNWFTSDEARIWLQRDGTEPFCLRPEQILLSKSNTGPWIVTKSQFKGSVTEVDLVYEATGVVRRFWYRATGNDLRFGDRVAIVLA